MPRASRPHRRWPAWLAIGLIGWGVPAMARADSVAPVGVRSSLARYGAASGSTYTVESGVHYQAWYAGSGNRTITVFINNFENDGMIVADDFHNAIQQSYTVAIPSSGTWNIYLYADGTYDLCSSGCFNATRPRFSWTWAAPNTKATNDDFGSALEEGIYIHVTDQASTGGIVWDAYHNDGYTEVDLTIPWVPAPTALTGTATGVLASTAVLNGTVNPNGGQTSYHFEYGLSDTYGRVTPTVVVGFGTADVAVNAALDDLDCGGVVYHFRLVTDSDPGGTATGSDRTFTTPACTPVTATTGLASAIAQNSATLNGTVNPNGTVATAHFEYGSTTAYGLTTGPQAVGSGTGSVPVAAAISGLTCGTPFHFRIIGSNRAGPSPGVDQTFSTSACPPTVATDPAAGILQSQATLHGTVNPRGSATTAYFVYGATGSYGQQTTPQGLGAGSAPVSLTAAVADLEPGTLYHYQVVASNASGPTPTNGGDRTFTTPPCTCSIIPGAETYPAGRTHASAQVVTEAGCRWAATSDAEWIIITAGSGTGESTLRFTIEPNQTGLLRSAAIRVAGQTLTVTQEAVSGTPVIALSGSLGFGTVPVGSTTSRILTIANTGTAPLVVSGLTVPPGFAGTWSGTIAAGTSQPVTVTFAPASASGYGGTARVTANHSSGTDTIEISGTGVVATRIIELSGALSFGGVLVGSTVVRTLSIANSGTVTLTVSGIAYPPGFSGNWPGGAVPAGGRQDVAVTFAPTAVAAYGGTITVTADDTNGGNTTAASGTGAAPARIIEVSGNLAFGDVPIGTLPTGTFAIANTGNTLMTVSRIDYPVGFTGNWPGGTVPAGGTQAVTVTFAPTAAISYGGTVTIVADHSGGANTIAASGTGRTDPQGIIELTGDLAFGKVQIDTTATRALSVCNRGTARTVVTHVSYPAAFQGESFTFELYPSWCTELHVTFSPTALTDYGGALVVTASDAGGTKTAPVSGQGAPVPTRVVGLSGNLAFGNVQMGTTTTRVLTIANSGNTTLTVHGIGYPAGFSGEWSGAIAAGGSQAVTVTFAPTAETPYGGSITVTGDQTAGTNTIGASGTGTGTPERVIGLAGDLAFGAVGLSSSVSRALTITNTGFQALTVSQISYPAGFSGNWPGGSIAAGASQVVTVTFTPTAAMAYGGTITVSANHTRGVNTIGASGMGETRVIQVSGDMTFADVLVGTTRTRLLTIANSGTAPLVVSGLSCPPGFSGTWSGTVAPGASRAVPITFAPTTATEYGGTIAVAANQTSGQPTIAASGTATHGISRSIRLAGDLAFGHVRIGSTAVRSFTITNTGNAPLTVSGIALPAGYLGDWQGSITPEASQVVSVTFGPTAAAAYDGIATVQADQQSGTQTMPVTGYGTASDPSAAVYDATLKVPRCTLTGTACDSGPTLLVGRGPTETNPPNTLYNTCGDGTWRSDEKVERLRVFATDGTTIDAGKRITIEATVVANAATPSERWLYDRMEIYIASVAPAPTWQLVHDHGYICCGRQVVTATYDIPIGSGGALAVRAVLKRNGASEPCRKTFGPSDYDDADDLVFTLPRNPQPIVTALSPASVVAGSGRFTLTVKGRGFAPDSRVLWNGAERPTTFVDSTRLDVEIPYADVVVAGTAAVSVSTPAPGGGLSNQTVFSITAACTTTGRDVSAKSSWQDALVAVSAGDAVTMTAAGQWGIADGRGMTNQNGYSGLAGGPAEYVPIPTERLMALVGRLGSTSAPFLVGSGLQGVATETGSLWFAPNADWRILWATWGGVGVTVGVCTTPPIFLQHPSDQRVAEGGTATFEVTASSSPPAAYRWQTSTDGGATWLDLVEGPTQQGVASPSLTVSNVGLGATGTTYRAVATKSVAAVASLPATLTVVSAPTVVGLTPTSGRVGQTVSVTGTDFSGATAVRFNGTAARRFTVHSPTSLTATVPPGATTGPVSVTTVGGTGTSGAVFTVDIPTWSDHPLQQGGTRVKVVHIAELREAIDALRGGADLPPMPWTDPVLTPGETTIKAAHLFELRAGLAAVYVALGRPEPAFSSPAISAGQTVIAAAHIAEIRAAILAIW